MGGSWKEEGVHTKYATGEHYRVELGSDPLTSSCAFSSSLPDDWYVW
jgi:hypothetical protein